MDSIVVISKKYAESDIKHTVRHSFGDISIEIYLDDFLANLASEIDGLHFIVTKEQLLKKMLLKSKNVINDMKQSSVYNSSNVKK